MGGLWILGFENLTLSISFDVQNVTEFDFGKVIAVVGYRKLMG